MIFNTEQKKAVEHLDGPALVLAGPGSGKTAVITGRTIRLVRECRISPWRVLVITFTKAAAEEMKQRYMQAADPQEYGVCFGTFHAVFFRILREDGGLSGRAVISGSDAFALASAAFKKNCGERHFTNEDVKQILSEISRRKSGGLTGKRSVPCTDEEFETIYREYDRALRDSGKLDYDDILVRCHELLLKNARALERWKKAFDYILVDEYQDINRVQYEVLRLLAAPKNNIFVVGDDDQSIYAFRGACPGLTKTFLDDFPGAERIILNTNYRSGRSITAAALSMIGHNRERFEKRIITASKEKGKVEILCFEDRREEYTALAEMLKNTDYNESAVLFRTNRQPRVLAGTLESRGIPLSLTERFSEIYSHHITQDILAYSRIAAGSGTRADYLRICNKPERYIKREWFTGEKVDLSAIEERIRPRGENLGNLPRVCGMLGGLDPFGTIMFLRHGAGYEDYLKCFADRNGCDEGELFEILEELTETARISKNVAEWEKRLKDEENGGTKVIQKRFGKEEHRDTKERGKRFENEEDGAAVQLLTFHSSKGLEFRNVYIIDMNEDVVPLKTATTAEALEEERRAAYVAMTRAKEKLVIMYVKKRGGRFVQPSRFLREIQTKTVCC